MGHYEQLGLRERVVVELRRGQGWSMRQIGEELGRAACTVSRELARNAQPTKQWTL